MGSRKMFPSKIPTRKILTDQTLPGKFTPGEFPLRKFSSGIFLPISLNLSCYKMLFLHLTFCPKMGGRVYMYIFPGRKFFIHPEGIGIFS